MRNLVYDILFYFALPIICWEIGRGYFSDYLVLLASTFPGIIYSLYRFYESKELNFTRVYFLINILMGLLIELVSGSALRILWYNAFYSLGLCILYLGSCLMPKPLFFYFALDIFVLQEYDKQWTSELLVKKEALRCLRLLSFVNSMKELVFTVVLMKLLIQYGVEKYTLTVLFDQLLSLLMSGFLILGYSFLYKLLNEIVTVKKLSTRKSKLKIPMYSLHIIFEKYYFFLRKHFF